MAAAIVADETPPEYAHLPRTREAARASGSKHYLPMTRCRDHDDLSPRYTSTGRCAKCLRIAMQRVVDKDPEGHRAKEAARRFANRERNSARVRKRYADNIDRERAKGRQRRRDNPVKLRAQAKAFRDADPQRQREYQRKSREKRKAQRLAWQRAYREKNRDLYSSAQRARWARKVNAMPSWVTRAEIDALYEEAARLTVETGVRYSVDHIYPLKHRDFCGLHVPWNLQVMTLSDNCRKNNMSPEEWLARR